jgi:hypothetical protein
LYQLIQKKNFMPNVIIFTNDNGNVGICVPTGEVPIEIVKAKDIPSGKQSYIVDSSTLPETAYDFFDAWEQTNGVVTVNIAKAKELKKKYLRFDREPLLDEQDVLFQRALETGADTSAIVAEKQRLRNLPTLVDSAQTLEELRSIKASL